MSDDILYRDKFERPEIFLSELLRNGAQGKFVKREDNPVVIQRAVVLAVDVLGGKLENPNGEGSVTHIVDGKNIELKANVGPENPRGSLKGRVITEGSDQFVSDERLHVFWPILPEHIAVPIKPGEHVYIMFEDEYREHGLWLGKVPGHEGLNFFRGQDSFRERKSLKTKFGVAQEKSPLDTDDEAGETRPRSSLQNLFGGK